jgi:hypothetical protein
MIQFMLTYYIHVPQRSCSVFSARPCNGTWIWSLSRHLSSFYLPRTAEICVPVEIWTIYFRNIISSVSVYLKYGLSGRIEKLVKSLCTPWGHTGAVETVPLIYNLSSRWRWEVRRTPRPLYLQGKWPVFELYWPACSQSLTDYAAPSSVSKLILELF